MYKWCCITRSVCSENLKIKNGCCNNEELHIRYLSNTCMKFNRDNYCNLNLKGGNSMLYNSYNVGK